MFVAPNHLFQQKEAKLNSCLITKLCLYMMNNRNILTIMSFLSFVTDVLIDHKTPFRNVLFIVKDCLTTTGWLWVTVVSLF